MRTFFSIIFAAAILLPGVALAANLSVYPASIVLKKGDSVGFLVHLQSNNSINTLGTAVTLPPNLTFLSVSDGTVITNWIQRPTFDSASSSVSFAGIMPNGWSGDGVVAVVHVAAKEAGTYSLAFDKSQTEVYKNDGKATPEPVVYGVAGINVFAHAFEPLWIAAAVVVVLALLLVYIVRRRYKVSLV